MFSHEFDDPELIKAIEDFLQQGKPEYAEEVVPLSAVRPEWRDLVAKMQQQGDELSSFLNNLENIQTDLVPVEQAVIPTDLAALAASTADLVITANIPDVGSEVVHVRDWPTSPFKAFTVHLSDNAVPDFLPARSIDFENYLSGNVQELMPELAKAFGIDQEQTRPMKLTISAQAGAIMDPQTKPIMEHIVSTFPDAPHIGNFYTEYYFFKNRMGKAIRLNERLLGIRVIEEDYALSQVTAGDLVIAKTGLLAVQQGVISRLRSESI
jgi:hypothetical protein